VGTEANTKIRAVPNCQCQRSHCCTRRAKRGVRG